MKRTILIAILIMLALPTMAACAAAQPETVEVVVTREIEVEKVVVETVEVEKEVEVVVTTEVEVVKEVEVEIPAELPQIRVAYSSSPDMEDIPSLLAMKLLADQGYRLTPTFYAQPEQAVEALNSGDADINSGDSARSVWQGISKGANIVTIMEQTANSWSIYSVPEIEECVDLEGQRFAQHSEGAVSKAMSDAFVKENCPGTEPEILIIPGSENRAAALLAGEIDATPVELADAVQINLEAPGQYHVLTNFAVSVPKLKSTVTAVNRDFAAEHPEIVNDYIRATLTVHRQIQENPAILIAEATKWLPIEEELLPKIIEAYLEINAWDVNGGLDEEAIQFSIDFFTDAGQLDPGLTVEKVADLSYLNEVLNEMGRQ